jgi:DNA-binding NtrC family response regulator
VPHLLLVDDDPEALEWLTELAKGEGFTVSQADSLRAARIHMSRLQPDILLTDLRMPGKLDGLGVLGEVKKRAPDTQVLVMTAFASADTAPQFSGRKGRFLRRERS